MTKAEILKEFELFSLPTGGIGSWLSDRTHGDVFDRLASLPQEPLTAVQLNQLLVLGHEAPVSDGFFRYYWLDASPEHPYVVTDLSGFEEQWTNGSQIISLSQLKWGLYRLYIDALLYYVNVRTAFRELRNRSFEELVAIFRSRRIDTEAVKRRGPPLPLRPIAKDNRYLISEMACKSFGDAPDSVGDLREALFDAFRAYTSAGARSVTVRTLLEGTPLATPFAGRQAEFIFSADEVLDDEVPSEDELGQRYEAIAAKFVESRQAALDNTRYYLSMVNDLDVYVATSMRTREDFRNMADTCERIFSDVRLRDLNLRYFDPTLSAAGGHEDKGLIECLMVKCAKVLVYCAGDRESYGKAAEAAMALSLGKPVIFYCDHEQRSTFYRDVHPLGRLIEFETGIAVGAMVTDDLDDVPNLLSRIFENKMEYSLEQSKPGYIRLKERLTNSVVRLQSNDPLLTETFQNHYYGQATRH